jgi:hypothetical protein
MDPNANLEEQRWLRAALLESAEAGVREWGAIAHRLAELSKAMDEWLSKGGALPTRWAR